MNDDSEYKVVPYAQLPAVLTEMSEVWSLADHLSKAFDSKYHRLLCQKSYSAEDLRSEAFLRVMLGTSVNDKAMKLPIFTLHFTV